VLTIHDMCAFAANFQVPQTTGFLIQKLQQQWATTQQNIISYLSHISQHNNSSSKERF
jgi:hypothetical protein